MKGKRLGWSGPASVEWGGGEVGRAAEWARPAGPVAGGGKKRLVGLGLGRLTCEKQKGRGSSRPG